jgi:site-specific DNA-methyltransferase (adenine-specific)
VSKKPAHRNPGQRDRKDQPKEKRRGFSRPHPKEDRRKTADPWKLNGLLPPLSPKEYEELRESIRRDGVLVPSIVDSAGNVVDGHNRERVCKELGIDCPKVIREFASEAEKLQLAIKLNVNRRHLTGKQRRELIAIYLEVDPGINDRHLGDVIGVSKNTVAAERERLEATGQIDQLQQRLGRDGKLRPAKYHQIIANTPKEAEQARQLINTLPASCDGKILDVTTAARRSQRHVRKQQREAQVVVPSPDEEIRAYCCPFQELEERAGIAPASVNTIITDILYDRDFLTQLPDLAKFAARLLVPGGLFVTLSGALYLDQVMKHLRDHLEWGWLGMSVWDGDANLVHPRQVTSQCKPILVFSKGKWKERGMWPDVFRVNTKEKDWHPMQQPLEESEKCVRYFTQPGDLVVDPCSGSFTTALACRNLGRRFIGCDIRSEYVSKGQARLAGLSAADWERANSQNSDQHQENGKE